MTYFLQNKFLSSCLCVFLSLHSFRLSVNADDLKSPRSSRKIQTHFFRVVLFIKVSAFKNHSGKNKRRRHRNLPYSETISRVSLNRCDNIQTLHHTLWRYTFTSDTLVQLFFSCISKTTNCPIESTADNSDTRKN